MKEERTIPNKANIPPNPSHRHAKRIPICAIIKNIEVTIFVESELGTPPLAMMSGIKKKKNNATRNVPRILAIPLRVITLFDETFVTSFIITSPNLFYGAYFSYSNRKLL
jgi:hypothetical protein